VSNLSTGMVSLARITGQALSHVVLVNCSLALLVSIRIVPPTAWTSNWARRATARADEIRHKVQSDVMFQECVKTGKRPSESLSRVNAYLTRSSLFPVQPDSVILANVALFVCGANFHSTVVQPL
jgi:hypothetical protein